MPEIPSVSDLIATLDRKRIRLSIVGGRIRYSGPQGCGQSAEVLQARQRAAEITSYMTSAREHAQPMMPLGAYPREGPAPLSHMQRWWLDLEREVGQNMHTVLIIPVNTEMNVSVWQRAFDEVARRHESLRTRFVSDGSGIVPTVDQPDSVPMAVHDYSGHAAERREAMVDELTVRLRFWRFQMLGGRLFAVSLVKLTEDSHVVLISAHHILTDGWANRLLKEELQKTYSELLIGRPTPRPELRFQLTDYAFWESHWMGVSEGRDPCAHWTARLSGVLPMDPATDAPRGKAPTAHPEATQQVVLSKSTLSDLRRFSRSHGLTLAETLLAIYGLLLARWAQRSDVLIGNYMAGRIVPGTEVLLGCFARNQPIYLVIDSEVTVADYMAQVHTSYLEALDLRRAVSMKLAWEKRLHCVIASFGKFEIEVDAPPAVAPAGGSLPVNHEVALFLTETKSLMFGEISYAADLYSSARMTTLRNDLCAVAAGLHELQSSRIGDVMKLAG